MLMRFCIRIRLADALRLAGRWHRRAVQLSHGHNTLSALDEVPRVAGRSITIATMDAGYGVVRVFAELEARWIEAIVPTYDPRQTTALSSEAQHTASSVARTEVVRSDNKGAK